jgi:formiminotetrahydrofolate cyclodeaminase
MPDRLSEMPARELLARLSTRAPVPGGGSAAALAGAMGAALVHMVVELTTGRPSAAPHEALLAELGGDAARLRDALVDLAEEDAAAYEAVVAARRLPNETEAERIERDQRIASATHEATDVPLRTAHAAAQVFALAERLAPVGNRNAITDAGVGGMLAATALRGAALNVQVNLPYLATDDPLATDAGTAIAELLDGLERREPALRQVVAERLG